MRSAENGHSFANGNGPGPGEITIAGVPLDQYHWWLMV